jgi:ataxia telangiectasia mutated family protein
VSFTLGKHADALYTSILAKLESPEWVSNKEVRVLRQKELDSLEGLMKNQQPENNAAEIQKHVKKLRNQIQADEAEVTKLEKDRTDFLVDAARHYVIALQFADKFDMAVFELCNLWFNEKCSVVVSEYLKKKLHSIPSRKWLPLSYQIASRLGVGGDEVSKTFCETLEELVLLMSKEHPHQMMFKLLALCNGRNLPSGHIERSSNHVVDEAKIAAATKLVDKLKIGGLGALVKSYELLCAAYVELSYHDLPVRGRAAVGASMEPVQDIPSQSAILQISKLRLPVSTLEQPLGVAVPDSCPKIEKFERTYELVGGMNKPKRIKCLGSNGKWYQELLKGGDDLKQDAVMQQLFSFANRLLAQESNSRSRHLQVRSYCVIPLTPASGILEWVENSVALGNYLVQGSRAAHVRFRPGDLPHAEVSASMKKATDDQKVAVYSKMCSKFQPVLHHFFLEKFHDPFTWFERRLRYSRSLATSSIVGYIVGLGDRHLQNILLDETSADVVHIDLGVAFDQVLLKKELFFFVKRKKIRDARFRFRKRCRFV